MANYTLTSSAVQPSATAKRILCTAGATIGAGQPIYLDSTAVDARGEPKAKLADANATADTALVRGIAINSASDGQPLYYITEDDDYAHGLTTPTVGDIVITSSTAGALAPSSDMATGMYPTVLMVIESATKARVRILSGRAAKP